MVVVGEGEGEEEKDKTKKSTTLLRLFLLLQRRRRRGGEPWPRGSLRYSSGAEALARHLSSRIPPRGLAWSSEKEKMMTL